MPDIAQFGTSSYPPIVYGIKSITPSAQRQILFMKPTNNNISLKSNEKAKISLLNNKNISSFEKQILNKRSLGSKNVKRLVLNTLSNNTHPIFPSTEHIIDQLTNLTMTTNQNFYSNKLITISINYTNKCQIFHYSNGKFYISCFELARILNTNEDALDKETVRKQIQFFPILFFVLYFKMFSRLRIYQSNKLFNLFDNPDNCCQHRMNCCRPYIFLFLISSIIPVLKMTKYLNHYYQIVLAFEQLLNM
jgi:hypothetical protein